MAKLSKKELRQPDAVWQASASALSWMQSQWVLLSIIAGLVLFILVGGAFYVHTTRQSEAEAQYYYAKAVGEFQQWKLADEKNRTDVRAKLDEALKKLDADFSHSKATQFAGLLRAQVAIEEKSWDQALTHLKEFEKSLPQRRRSLAWYPMAVVQEQLGQSEEALKTFGKINQSKDPTYRKWSLLGEARQLVALNRRSEAQKLYEQFISEFPKAQEITLVRGLMQLNAEPAK